MSCWNLCRATAISLSCAELVANHLHITGCIVRRVLCSVSLPPPSPRFFFLCVWFGPSFTFLFFASCSSFPFLLLLLILLFLFYVLPVLILITFSFFLLHLA